MIGSVWNFSFWVLEFVSDFVFQISDFSHAHSTVFGLVESLWITSPRPTGRPQVIHRPFWRVVRFSEHVIADGFGSYIFIKMFSHFPFRFVLTG